MERREAVNMVLAEYISRPRSGLVHLEAEPDPSSDQTLVIPGMSFQQIDAALLDAYDQQLIDRRDRTDNSAWILWTGVRVLPAGLRRLGEWPPEGKEWQRGPWDEATWGIVDLPVLRHLDEEPPAHGFLFKPQWGSQSPLGEVEANAFWDAVLRLGDAGMIGGTLTSDGIQDLRITQRGDQVLHDEQPDELIEAQQQLAAGDLRAAAVSCGVVLENHLKVLATARALATVNVNGRALTADALNTALYKAGVYGPGDAGKPDQAQVSAWQKLRNEAAHDRAPTFTAAQVELMIAGVHDFIDRHPE